MSTDGRCTHCGAALTADAAWCSLCYTPVPVAAPVVARHAPEPAVVVEHPDHPSAPVRVAGGHPSLYPQITPERLGRHARPAAEDAPARQIPVGVPQPRFAPQAMSASVAEAVEKATPMWPCGRCGAQVAIDADVCPDCGAGFLEGAGGDGPQLVLPGIGDLGSKTQAQRYLIAGGVGLAAALLLVGLVALVGAIFS